jgi:hypothetical protein
VSRTRKREYTGSKRFDPSCRNRGSCPWCENGRQHCNERRQPAPDEDDQPTAPED